MKDAETQLVKFLRKCGLTNGTSLGTHMGICDIAADMIENLSAERDAWKHRTEAAEKDLHSVIRRVDDGCLLCKHYFPCQGKDCPHYISGIGVTGQNGKEYPDWKWTCDDFDYGTCPAMENTPCNGCDFENHWQWRGPVDADGHKEA